MTGTTTPTTVGDLTELIPDFLRSLRAANESPRTVETYGEAARAATSSARLVVQL